MTQVDSSLTDGTPLDEPARSVRRKAVRRAGPPPGAAATTVGVHTAPVAESAPVGDASTATVETSTAVEPSAESSSTQSDSTTDARGRKRPRAKAVMLVGAPVALIVALIAAGAYLFFDNRGEATQDALRDQYLSTARQTALNMTTLHVDTAQDDVDRLLAGASGDFKAQFDGRETQFVDVVKQAGVNSDGEIVAAGLETLDGNCGTSLVAAHATVTNVGSADPQPRDFRLRVVVCGSDGAMTATKVEFVP